MTGCSLGVLAGRYKVASFSRSSRRSRSRVKRDSFLSSCEEHLNARAIDESIALFQIREEIQAFLVSACVTRLRLVG